MRMATIAVCLLMAGAFAAFGFWWRANTQADTADSADTRSRQFHQTRQPADDETDLAPAAAAPNGTDQRSTRERSTDTVSDEGRQWREALASSDDQVRREALLELGKRDDTDPKLLTDVLAEDPSPRIRAAAARGLSRLGRREAIPQLLDALDDEDINVRTWAITALNNTLIGVRFPYNANEPREARLRHIAIIRTRLTAWGVLPDGTGE